MFVCLDDASCVVHPEELSQDGGKTKPFPRKFTVSGHVLTKQKLERKREQRLRRQAKQDEEDATRTYETFGLGAFATWSDGEKCLTAACDEHVTVLYSGDFCVPDVHKLDDMHSAYVR